MSHVVGQVGGIVVLQIVPLSLQSVLPTAVTSLFSVAAALSHVDVLLYLKLPDFIVLCVVQQR